MAVVKKIIISASGDPSVGIFPASWVISSDCNDGFVIDLDCYVAEDQDTVLQDLERDLQSLFNEYIAGEPVKVYFDCEF